MKTNLFSSNNKNNNNNDNTGNGNGRGKSPRRHTLSSSNSLQQELDGTVVTEDNPPPRRRGSSGNNNNNNHGQQQQQPQRKFGVVGTGSLSTTTKRMAGDVNKVVMNTVMAPVQVAGKVAQVAANAGTKASHAVVASTQMASHAVVETLGEASAMASQNSKKVVKGAKGIMHTISSGGGNYYNKNWGSHLSHKWRHNMHSKDYSKSKWEEGLEVIDQLLDPHSDTYSVMTPDQRQKLAHVKKLLLKTASSSSSVSNADSRRIQHVPRELLRSTASHSSAGNWSVINNPSASRTQRDQLESSTFILQEYAGIQDTSAAAILLDDLSEEDNLGESSRARINSSDNDSSQTAFTEDPTFTDEDSGSDACTKISKNSPNKTPILPVSDGNDTADTQKISDPADAAVKSSSPDEQQAAQTRPPSNTILQDDKYFVPPEFMELPKDSQLELSRLLTWESIRQWDFDVFYLNQVTQGHPLLFLGWAVLGSPYAQQAMQKHLGLPIDDNVNTTTASSGIKNFSGYAFIDEFNIPPKKMCNYIRTIESDYNAENPYHNAIHAADVVQTLHALIQQSHGQSFMKHCSQTDLFSILLSAVVHDVDHPGKTNSFHIQLKSELAVMYNDKSVLENWHVAHAFARLLGVDLKEQSSAGGSKLKIREVLEAQKRNNQPNPAVPNNFLCNTTKEQFSTIRKRIIDAVLQTDMIHHFEMVNGMRGMLLQDDDSSDCSPVKATERSWKILEFMLHLADINSQAKPAPLFEQWSRRCLDEMFNQGDEEAALGLPISLLCDRNTTGIPESQVGFIRFVVEPAFEVLGSYIPFVREAVMPIIHGNLEYWTGQIEEQDSKSGHGTK